ncbi:MAG: right-handed parallel beta-helix repeat-containing protein [Treponema sp.]|uniref:right-handed parallel beta-helix repeat-containing protein n=1 Tax=Treponema sp. TaxID=166 RepID=UPI00298E6F13|nr:right-handed parallel beta-helix repeat-containing protein [Treponema sp.]MCR5386141.1 right-handed parallel beta-helix repeat-containing protein [Treponema sp.]
MRKKLNVFNTVLFTLIFCFMLGNCEDISFDKSLVKQIEDDTTFTIQFCGGPVSSPEWSNMVFLKYKIGSTITAADLPNTNTNSEMASWKPGYVIKSWKVHYNSVSNITLDSESVSSIVLNGNDVTLYPEWTIARTLTLMDGCPDSSGKEFSGNCSYKILFWTGENVKIPKPEAQFKSGDNVVEFDGWFKDPAFNNACSGDGTFMDDGTYISWQTQDSTVDTTLYAKWKYKYVYFDPANKTGKADDANTGIDRNHPVSTVAEAKKYMQSNDKAEAVKMMSGISSNFSDLSGLTTSTYNNAVYLRDSTLKNALVGINNNFTPINIENVTFDGGYDGSEASKAEAPVFSGGKLTLDTVVVRNNYNKQSDFSAVNAYGTGNSLNNCEFFNNHSLGSVIKISNESTLTNTTIHDNTGNGVNYNKSTTGGEYKFTIDKCTILNNTGYNLYFTGEDKGIYTTPGTGKIEIKDSIIKNQGAGSNLGNMYVINKKRIYIASDVLFDTAPVRFDYVSADKSCYPAFVLNASFPGPKIDGTTNNVVIYSEHYTDNPVVIEDETGGTLLASSYSLFTCGHSSSGYGINSDGKIVPIGSISIGIDNPSGFTEIDLGDLAVTQVNLNASGDTVIRFNLNSGVAEKLAEWTLTGTSNIAHPIQYMIDSTYGCVQAEYDSGTGKWYAYIVIGRKPDDTIPNAFETSDNPYTLTKGLHTLQIYSEAKEANAVVTKKTYNIVVK